MIPVTTFSWPHGRISRWEGLASIWSDWYSFWSLGQLSLGISTMQGRWPKQDNYVVLNSCGLQTSLKIKGYDEKKPLSSAESSISLF